MVIYSGLPTSVLLLKGKVPVSVDVLTPATGVNEYCLRVLTPCKRWIATRVLKVPTAFIFEWKSSTLHSFAFQKAVILIVFPILELDINMVNWDVPAHIFDIYCGFRSVYLHLMAASYI
jgi:hypothetical protein